MKTLYILFLLTLWPVNLTWGQSLRDRAHETARDIDENLTAEEIDSMIRSFDDTGVETDTAFSASRRLEAIEKGMAIENIKADSAYLVPGWERYPDRWYADTIRLCDTVIKYFDATYRTDLGQSDSTGKIYSKDSSWVDTLITYRDSIVHKPRKQVWLTDEEYYILMKLIEDNSILWYNLDNPALYGKDRVK